MGHKQERNWVWTHVTERDQGQEALVRMEAQKQIQEDEYQQLTNHSNSLLPN